MNADEMIEKFGDQAYHKAVEFAVIGQRLGDMEGAQLAAEAAKELLRRGYHEKPRDQVVNT
jgi:histidinol phosphatase-like enzyme